MLHEQQLLEMAETYRDMAKTALAPDLRVEFTERYEAVALTVERQREIPPTP